MKTIKLITLFTLSLLFANTAISATIGVGPISTYGVFADQETAITLTQLELIKLDKYQVLDKFDMREVADYDQYKNCFGKSCLIEFGKELDVNFILSGSIDALGKKIIVTLKLIDIQSEKIVKTRTSEFSNQEKELQRMIGIVLMEMHGETPDPLIKKQLEFDAGQITAGNLNRINNSGPRIGIAYTVGSLNEFATREEQYGGLEISPIVTNIGFQFEKQYVGTENFSALFEGIVNFTGLEQGQFIPGISLLNGLRFGKQGWEFAFGPTFGLTKTSVGFFTKDGQNLFGEEAPRYWTQSEYEATPFAENPIYNYGYEYTRNLDSRGRIDVTTRWIMAFGRTFQSGSLNIPVNVFYSSQKGGGMAGLSIGFNVTKNTKNIN